MWVCPRDKRTYLVDNESELVYTQPDKKGAAWPVLVGVRDGSELTRTDNGTGEWALAWGFGMCMNVHQQHLMATLVLEPIAVVCLWAPTVTTLLP